MTAKKEFSWGVVQDDQTKTDWELLQQDEMIQKEWDANEREVEKRQRKELLEKDPDAIVKMERYAIWHCHARCGFKADRRDESAIIAHKSTCGWQIEEREKNEADKKAEFDGLRYMRGALMLFEQSKRDIAQAEKVIAKEKSRSDCNLDYVKCVLQPRLDSAKADMLRAQKLKHDALNEPNPITKQKAAEVYSKYLKMDEKARKQVFIDGLSLA
jgi:hypothetical protein